VSRTGRGYTEKLCKNPEHFTMMPLDEFPVKNGRKTAWCKQCLHNNDDYHRIVAFIHDNPQTYGLQISNELSLSRYTTKKVIDQLQEEGVITLKWNPTDGRINYLELSEYGEQIIA